MKCPLCGNEMQEDLHAVEDGVKWRNLPPKKDCKKGDDWPYDTKHARGLDNWICINDEHMKEDCVVFDREDLLNMVKDIVKIPGMLKEIEKIIYGTCEKCGKQLCHCGDPKQPHCSDSRCGWVMK